MPFDGRENPVLNVLDKVINVLDNPRKWCKHTQGSPESQMCLIGAVGYMANGCKFDPLENRHSAAWKLHELMAEEANRRGFHGTWPEVNFNNAPSTTHDDIKDFLASVRQRLVLAPG